MSWDLNLDDSNTIYLGDTVACDVGTPQEPVLAIGRAVDIDPFTLKLTIALGENIFLKTPAIFVEWLLRRRNIFRGGAKETWGLEE